MPPKKDSEGLDKLIKNLGNTVDNFRRAQNTISKDLNKIFEALEFCKTPELTIKTLEEAIEGME